MLLETLFKLRPGPARWVNIPFALILILFTLMGASYGGISAIWLYLILLPVFIVQAAWPTLFGWSLTVAGWALVVGMVLYYSYGSSEGVLNLPVLGYVAPLVVLLISKPRTRL